MATRRHLIAVAVCLALSALGLVFFFWNTNWAELRRALSGANYLYLIPALLLTLATYPLRAYRWQILLRPIKRIQWIHLLSATTIGFMSNCVLPARVGELVRATVIGVKEKISTATALTTVIVERIFDLLAVGFFVMVVLVLMPADSRAPASAAVKPRPEAAAAAAAPANAASPASQPAKTFSVRDLRKWGVVVGVVTAGAFAILFLMKLFPSATLRAGRAPLRLLPKPLAARGTRILMGLVAGLQSLESVGQIFYLAVLSIIHWGLQVVSNIVIGRCFGLHFNFAQGSLIFVISALAVAVPQGPGFVGVFDCAILVALQILAVNISTAQSYAIVLHFLCIIPVTLVGFAFLWWEGLSLKQVTEAEKQS